MMTCRDAFEFLADYLTGDLPPSVQVAFDEHLAECPGCRQYLATYRQTILVGKTAVKDLAAETDDELLDALVVAILSARSHDRPN